jgi:hypothetical protein
MIEYFIPCLSPLKRDKLYFCQKTYVFGYESYLQGGFVHGKV